MLYDLLLRDIIEITLYSSCIFLFCNWLKTDKTKNLLGYFFAYSALVICAWFTQLHTLMPFLCAYAPIALLLFIILHEKTLQRNFVALYSIAPAHVVAQDWLNTLISNCLTSINANKSITVVIEHNDGLDPFLDTPFILNASIHKNIFDLLFSSQSYDQQKMIWISSKGHIKGINASWIFNQQINADSLFYTLHNDAIIISAHPNTRMFTIIHSGKEIKNIPAHQVYTLIKKQLFISSPKQKGAYRESNSAETSLSR